MKNYTTLTEHSDEIVLSNHCIKKKFDDLNTVYMLLKASMLDLHDVNKERILRVENAVDKLIDNEEGKAE